MKELLTIKEIMKKLKLSKPTIYKLMDQGLPYKKIGNQLRFDADAVQEWVDQQN